jgi:hypothetical protein
MVFIFAVFIYFIMIFLHCSLVVAKRADEVEYKKEDK